MDAGVVVLFAARFHQYFRLLFPQHIRVRGQRRMYTEWVLELFSMLTEQRRDTHFGSRYCDETATRSTGHEAHLMIFPRG